MATAIAPRSDAPRPVCAGNTMHGLRTILIVVDDAALRQSLAEQLELNAEFASLPCGSGATALDLMRQSNFDAAVLDIELPDMDGRDLCRQMRTAGITCPDR